MEVHKNAILNTWGVFFYFFSQWILTVIVTRVSGYEVAGQYSLALSFANIFSILGMFGMRGILVSDVRYRYSDAQYSGLRIITCTIAVVCFFSALYLRNYTGSIAWCCIALMLFKLLECVLDLIVGILQRSDRFVWIAILYTISGFIPAFLFAISLYSGRSLPVAAFFMSLGFFVILGLYPFLEFAAQRKKHPFVSFRGTLPILHESLPLMLGSILDAIIVYLPRDAVEQVNGTTALGYYSTISIVVVVLSTLGSAVWGSVMPKLSYMIYAEEWQNTRRMIRLIMLGIIGSSVFILIFGNLIGPFFFSLIFGEEILEYMYLLTPVIMNAILLLINSFFPCFFIPIQKRFVLLYSNAVSCIFCAVLTRFWAEHAGLIGACLGLTVSLAIRTAILFFSYIYYMRKIERRG